MIQEIGHDVPQCATGILILKYFNQKAGRKFKIRKFSNGVTAKLAGRGEFSIGTIEEIREDILDSNKKVTPVAFAYSREGNNTAGRVSAD
jgi:hypothetical protein